MNFTTINVSMMNLSTMNLGTMNSTLNWSRLNLKFWFCQWLILSKLILLAINLSALNLSTLNLSTILNYNTLLLQLISTMNLFAVNLLDNSLSSNLKTRWKLLYILLFRTKWVNNPYYISISEKHVLVCVVGKCGSTNWREIAWKFHEDKTGLNRTYHFKFLKTLRDSTNKLPAVEQQNIISEIPELDNNVTSKVDNGRLNYRLVLVSKRRH